jgi:hypothetical protein
MTSLFPPWVKWKQAGQRPVRENLLLHPIQSGRGWWFRVIRLHDPYLTRSSRAFSLNAHYHGSLPQQLKVVWSLLLQADPEGPTLIFRAASWRTISNKS